MPQIKKPGLYETTIANRGPNPVTGPGGIPIDPVKAGDRLGLMVSDPTPAPVPAEVDHQFGDGEDATPIAAGCECHRWFEATDGSEWIATEIAPTDPRRRPAPGERFITTTVHGEKGELIFRYAARRGDREAHRAALARAKRLTAHPEQGPYVFVADVPAGWPADVRGILDQWRSRTIRPVVMGEHLVLSAAAGASWAAAISPDDETVVRVYGPLLVAEIEGSTMPCSVAGCPSPARAMVKVTTPICLAHLALPVGEEPVVEQPAAPKGGIRAALGSALASAIGA